MCALKSYKPVGSLSFVHVLLIKYRMLWTNWDALKSTSTRISVYKL